jgi:hypothetical protein
MKCRLPQIAVLLLGLTLHPRASGEPHPETGVEYWAIQSPLITNSAVVIGRISAIVSAGKRTYEPAMMRVDVQIKEVLRGRATNAIAIYEPTRRFKEFSTRRSLAGDFLFYLEPRTNGVGQLTYWSGFGVRPITATEKMLFAERMREYEKLRSFPVQSDAILEWGLRCCEQRITAWDGLIAIRNALYPGINFRKYGRTLDLATPVRRDQMKKIFDRIRDHWGGDWRLATTMMEGFAWLVDDRLFHHEVREYSTRLIQRPAEWNAVFRAFWRDYESRQLATDE